MTLSIQLLNHIKQRAVISIELCRVAPMSITLHHQLNALIWLKIKFAIINIDDNMTY